MSKRALKKYLKELDNSQLTDQIIDLYDRFKDVKNFYDFAFNPKEDKILNDFKTRIYREYFPASGRKPKARPSIAQKRIKTFIKLEMDPHLILEAMVFTINTAQRFSAERLRNSEAFYKSFYTSFKQAVLFAEYHGVVENVLPELIAIVQEAENQNWPNSPDFKVLLEN